VVLLQEVEELANSDLGVCHEAAAHLSTTYFITLPPTRHVGMEASQPTDLSEFRVVIDQMNLLPAISRRIRGIFLEWLIDDRHTKSLFHLRFHFKGELLCNVYYKLKIKLI